MPLIPIETPVGVVGTGLYGAIVSTPERSRVPSSEPGESKISSLPLLLVTIVITIVIFIFIVSLYDVIKERIIYLYTRSLSRNKSVARTPADREKILATSQASYEASIVFAIIAGLIVFILLPFLFTIYERIST